MAVVGAGVAGRCLALAALRRGHAVDVYDSGAPGCSFVAAGQLAPFCELDSAPPIVHRLGVESLPIWAEMAAECEGKFFFQHAGTLVVAAEHAELALLERRVARQVPGRWRAEAAQYEPELGGRFRDALYFPDEGQLETRACLVALHQLAVARGARWRGVARTIGAGLVDGSRYDVVGDCRGLGARRDWPSLRGVRGEIARVLAPEVRLSRPVRLLHPRFALYVAPRPAARYVIGATALESEANGPVCVRSALELLSAAYALHPGFGEAAIEELAAQCRPALPDNTPHLRGRPGLLRLNGLYRHGFLVAPALSEVALDHLEGKARSADLFEAEAA